MTFKINLEILGLSHKKNNQQSRLLQSSSQSIIQSCFNNQTSLSSHILLYQPDKNTTERIFTAMFHSLVWAAKCSCHLCQNICVDIFILLVSALISFIKYNISTYCRVQTESTQIKKKKKKHIPSAFFFLQQFRCLE